jgi:hypothetical protein
VEASTETTDGTHGLRVSRSVFKARPATEGDERYLYIEPSTEDYDMQGERVLQKALIETAPFFLKFGVIDIGHFSMPEMRELAAKHGYQRPELTRVGYPVDVDIGSNGLLLVKARLYRGDSEDAEQANRLWGQLNVGTRYYPSVGGKEFGKTCTVEGCTLYPLLWKNIGLWTEPINLMVKAVSVLPIDVFAKALTAGAGTDVAALEGGASLRRESIETGVRQLTQPEDAAYYRAASAYLRGDACPHVGIDPSLTILKSHFSECGGLDDYAATLAADRLADDLRRAFALRDSNDARLAA